MGRDSSIETGRARIGSGFRLPTERGESQRLGVLDSVRGIAAFIVVVHHCLLTYPAFSDFFFSNWRTQATTPLQYAFFHTPARLLWDGYEAVILFYVLSGLVLALPWVEQRPPSYRTFCIKRISRIYLPYAVAVAVAACLNVALRFNAPIPGQSDWVNAMGWSNPITPYGLLDHALMIGHHNTINGPIHSLVWEMRISLLFPLLIVPNVRWRERGAIGVVLVLAAIIALIQWRYAAPGQALHLLTSNPELGVTGKLALELEWTAYFALFFVMGSLIALRLRDIREAFARAHPWAVGGCLILALAVIQGHWAHVELVQDLMVGLGSTLLICAALAPGKFEALLSLRPLRWLGTISYSLYLVHVPVLLSALILLHDWVPVPVILIATPGVSVLVAWVFHHLVAAPSVRLGQALTRRRVPTELAPRHPAMTLQPGEP